MDTAQWPQEIGVLVKPMEEEMVSNTKPMLERKARPQKEQALNCPRCNSTNTKFCYYNNYSLTQPRYFCKTCRRYWTEGGSLRNVPVGGGSRKNKRSSSSSTSKKLSDLTPPPTYSHSQSSSQNPKIHKGQDLNLAFPTTTTDHYHSSISQFVELPNNIASSAPSSLSALELLRTGYSSGFTLQDFKPTLNFGVDGFVGGGGGYGSLHGVQDSSGGRLLFPFEDLRQVSTTTDQFEQSSRGQGDSTGYWTGMLGGGSW